MNKKYYRSVIQVEVLTDHLYYPDDLASINYDITHGGCSGMVENITTNEELTTEECAEALINQGSSVEFLIPDEDLKDEWKDD